MDGERHGQPGPAPSAMGGLLKDTHHHHWSKLKILINMMLGGPAECEKGNGRLWGPCEAEALS